MSDAPRSISIRPLRSDEALLHRRLRLAALCDAPDSFRDRFAPTEAQPASYWEALTRSVTAPGGNVMFIAVEGGAAIGSVYGLLDIERPTGGRIGGM